MKRLIYTVGALVLATTAYADPYMGMEYQSLSGTRSSQSYTTSQANVVVGYDLLVEDEIKHAVEYTGPISTSTGQLGAQNVETTLMSFGYKLTYQGLYGKAAYVKLDRDDADLEVSKDRAFMYSLGYQHAYDDTTMLRLSLDHLSSSAVSVSGFSVAALFAF